jgi:hypothetical protein
MDIRRIADCARKKLTTNINGSPGCRSDSASPNIRTVVFVRRGGTKSGNFCEYVQPDPLVSLVSQQDVVRFQNISQYTAEVQDLSVKGISRVDYSQEFIDNLTGVVIDGIIDPGTLDYTGGELYSIEGIAEGTTLTWDLILRKKTPSY